MKLKKGKFQNLNFQNEIIVKNFFQLEININKIGIMKVL